MKIAINKCYGWFQLSIMAQKRIAEILWKTAYFFHREYDDDLNVTYTLMDYQDLNNKTSTMLECYTVSTLPDDIDTISDKDYDAITLPNYTDYDNRSLPELIQVIEELWSDVSNHISNIKIVEIPDDVKWHINDYDWIETIHEDHRSW